MKRPRNIFLMIAVVFCGVSLFVGTGGLSNFAGINIAGLLPWNSNSNVSATATGRTSINQSSNSLNLDTLAPIHLVVLNGTGRTGLAREISLGVALHGCVVERVGNAPHDRYKQCFLVNRRLKNIVAADLAVRLGGLPVISEADGRTTEDAVLVLGANYEQLLQHLTHVQATNH